MELIGLSLGTQLPAWMNESLMKNSTTGCLFKANIVQFQLATFYQGNRRLE